MNDEKIMCRLNDIFNKILKERNEYLEKYISALECNGIKNAEAIIFYQLVIDGDRHLRTLCGIGISHERLPRLLPVA
jgi:hypothetical protein